MRILIVLVILITAVWEAGYREKTLPPQKGQGRQFATTGAPTGFAFNARDNLGVRRPSRVTKNGQDSRGTVETSSGATRGLKEVRPALQSTQSTQLEARADNRLASRSSADVVSLGDFTVTAYTNSPNDTGKAPGDTGYGITASGNPTEAGVTIAADWSVLPEGTEVEIEGLPGTFVVQDTGSAIKGRHIDLFVATESAALAWGVKRRKISVLKWGAVAH